MFDFYSNIEDYLSGKLSEADNNAFVLAMSKDKELKNIVENNQLYSVIADEIINDDLSLLIKKNHKFISETQFKSKTNKNSIWVLFLLLFSFMIGVAFYFFTKHDSQVGEQLYAEFYFAPKDSKRGEPSEDQNIDSGQCTKGHVYLELNKFKKAKIELQKSMAINDLQCSEQSMFFLALVSLKENDYDRAEEYLKLISSGGDSGFETKAKAILRKLENR